VEKIALLAPVKQVEDKISVFVPYRRPLPQEVHSQPDVRSQISPIHGINREEDSFSARGAVYL
jgi:hypothetical protein